MIRFEKLYCVCIILVSWPLQDRSVHTCSEDIILVQTNLSSYWIRKQFLHFCFVLHVCVRGKKKKSLPSLRPLDYRGKIIVLCNWHCQYYVTRTVKKNCIKVGGCVCVCLCVSHFFHTHPVLPPSAVWTGINDCTDRHKLISSNRQQQQQQWAKPSEDILWHARHHHHSLSANKDSDNRRH